MTTVNAWGNSWANSWLTSWTYTVAVPGPPSGGAGGGGRKRGQLPFRNRFHGPELFRPAPPKPEPAPEPEQPYVEGDPVTAKAPSGPTTLSELGALAPRYKPPAPRAPRQSKKTPAIAEPAIAPLEQM